MAVMYIIRGIPGSGKSTLSELIAREWGATICEADDYFYDEHYNYKFDKDKLNEAHKYCFDKVYKCLMDRKDVAVSNTNSTDWEINRYIDLAKDFGYDISVITLQSTFENVHGVPTDKMEAYKKKFVYKHFDLGL